MATSAALGGVVLTPDGAPVQSYSLVLLRALSAGESVTTRLRRSMARDRESVSVSDPRGAFRVDGLAAGTYDLVAHVPDGRLATVFGVSLTAGSHRGDVRLVPRAGFEVVGRVVEYETGRPLSGMPVVVPVPGRTLRTFTDAAGAFRLTSVPDLPGIHVRISPEPPTHVFEALYLSPQSDSRVDLGTIKLITADPRNPMKGKMGVSYTEEGGKIVVMTMMKDGPGERSGLRVGDVVLAIDGWQPNGDLPEVYRRIRADPGRVMTFVVQMGNQAPRELRFGRAM